MHLFQGKLHLENYKGTFKMKEQLNLEEPCGTCKGTGRLGTGSCPTCQGQGTVLNEAGKKLLHFLRNSIRTSEH
ncbi:hypothetical protein SRRS_53320 [Sporomusa rhizae]